MPTKLDLVRYEARHGASEIVSFEIDGWTHSENRQVQDIAANVRRFSDICETIVDTLKHERSAKSRTFYTRLNKLREIVEGMVADAEQFSDDQYEGEFADVVGYIDNCRRVLQGMAFAVGADREKYGYDPSDYTDWESWTDWGLWIEKGST